MTITLDNDMQWTLARICAENVLQAVKGARLRGIGYCQGAFLTDYDKRLVRQVRGAIASISDPVDRQRFIAAMRFNLREQRQAENSPAKWQDWLAERKPKQEAA